ncbi:MAG: 4-(cytidine 5'-diphospho)-2-C-methyl-D-erythritol kinase, partial [Firmicutes bacterium]|nr:4-(cytidine 5'-diphospho)-2-C-methyl-D-erythritol kinase [Bacillota bacterium]
MAYQGLAFAKVNLTLDIVGVRPDGYHLLESVMQSLSLCDVVEARPAAETMLTCDMPGLACDESNLALRAWRLMQQEFSLDGGMD